MRISALQFVLPGLLVLGACVEQRSADGLGCTQMAGCPAGYNCSNAMECRRICAGPQHCKEGQICSPQNLCLPLPTADAGRTESDSGTRSADAGVPIDAASTDGSATDDAGTDAGATDTGAALDGGIVDTGVPPDAGPTCGNGAIEPGEQCDDSDTEGTDGCDSDCAVEIGYACNGMPSVCAPLGAFNPPTLIAALSEATADDQDMTLTDDLLEACFRTDRSGNYDIYCATRTSSVGPWNPPAAVTIVNSADIEATPMFSSDGLTLWFHSSRLGGTGGNDIYRTTRAGRQDAWSAPTEVVELNSADSDSHVFVLPDTLTLYLSSTRAGPGGNSIFVSTRASAVSAWSAPQLVAELNSTGSDTSLVVRDRFAWLYSSRSGDQRIYFATSVGGTFAAPAEVTELNTGVESDPWVAPDVRTIFFTRSGDLYQATR